MKKIVLSMAGVLAATAFAPEAAAIPAYARQVGMACTACHQQHFPILNSFGRAFKAGGYTMMGAQGKVEGDHLSLPDTFNSSMIVKLRYQKSNGTAPAGSKTGREQTTADGQFQMFDELAFLMGGKISDNMGFFFEGQLGSTAPLAGITRLPMVWDMGAAKVSVVPFVADGGGAMVGYELSSGGVLRANRWSEHRRETSAVQYNTRVESASGFALVAQNDFGYVNVTKFSVESAFQDAGASNMGSTYLRAAATPTVAGWAMVAGVGAISGQSYSVSRAQTIVTEQTFVDLQAHGEVAGKELGVYAQYATVPKLDLAGNPAKRSAYHRNAGGNGVTDRTAFTIGADLSVIPHTLHLGAAYRMGEDGNLADRNGDDAFTVQAIYDLAQNVALHGIFTSYSGTHYDVASPNAATSLTTLMLEAAW